MNELPTNDDNQGLAVARLTIYAVAALSAILAGYLIAYLTT